jgi:nicotinate-nucleotide adenylyltransferase
VPDQKIVAFGGTFDPVHFGHLIAARAVAERLGAKRVVLVPAGLPPHKEPPLAGAEDRFAMLSLAIEGDELFEVNRLELDRPGPSYTYDTIVQLRRTLSAEAQLVWVVGLDAMLDLPNWHRASEVVDSVRLVTALRPPAPTDLKQVLAPLRGRFTDEQLDRLRTDVLVTPEIDISSTDIRRRVRQGMSIRYLTSPAVIDYIERHHLYR